MREAEAGAPRASHEHARILLVVLVLGWLVGGPVLKQGFGVRSPWLNGWYMFKGQGTKICWVQWTDGEGQPVDRLATRGLPPWNEVPRPVRNLVDRQEVLAEASKLCAALGPGARLYAHARCGGYAGWRLVEDGTRDLCTLSPPRRPGRRSR